MASAKKTVKKANRKKTPAKKGGVKKVVVKKKIIKKKATKKSPIKKVGSKKLRPKKAAKKAQPSKAATGKSVLKLGDLAPAFSRLNQNGKTINLSDFLGKQNVVLYFYPRAMTPGCTVQACGIRDTAEDFKNANAVVLGVSPDKVSSLVKFRERDQLNFDLLSDEDKSLAKAYGVWGLKKFMGRESMGVRRWTFIIGKDGSIKHVMDKVNTATHHADVLAFLKVL